MLGDSWGDSSGCVYLGVIFILYIGTLLKVTNSRIVLVTLATRTGPRVSGESVRSFKTASLVCPHSAQALMLQLPFFHLTPVVQLVNT